eukprot:m51a1_g7198 hypothetical protein (134) ;mRNA; f:192100-192562
MPQKKAQQPRKGPKAPDAKATAGTPGAGAGLPASVQPSSAGGTRIVVRAKPNAKSSGITGVEEEAVGVSVAEVARDGKANAALVEVVADALGVHRRDASIEAGARSHDKVVVVSGIAPADALARLRTAASQFS